jgi:hypothetical protein
MNLGQKNLGPKGSRPKESRPKESRKKDLGDKRISDIWISDKWISYKWILGQMNLGSKRISDPKGSQGQNNLGQNESLRILVRASLAISLLYKKVDKKVCLEKIIMACSSARACLRDLDGASFQNRSYWDRSALFWIPENTASLSRRQAVFHIIAKIPEV